MGNISYHKATINDIQILVDSRIEFLSEYWGRQEEVTERNLRTELWQFFEKEIPYNTYISWLAMDDEKFVAIGGMKLLQRPGSFRVPDGNCGYIVNMYTIPEYRRKGLAKTILQKLIESGRETGLNFFELQATKDGEPVYINHGFKIHEPSYRLIF